jgi:hypothetical protein
VPQLRRIICTTNAIESLHTHQGDLKIELVSYASVTAPMLPEREGTG